MLLIRLTMVALIFFLFYVVKKSITNSVPFKIRSSERAITKQLWLNNYQKVSKAIAKLQ